VQLWRELPRLEDLDCGDEDPSHQIDFVAITEVGRSQSWVVATIGVTDLGVEQFSRESIHAQGLVRSSPWLRLGDPMIGTNQPPITVIARRVR
jgi:hypothetical protein